MIKEKALAKIDNKIAIAVKMISYNREERALIDANIKRWLDKIKGLKELKEQVEKDQVDISNIQI
jgi:adenine-specific DNA glycosylase